MRELINRNLLPFRRAFTASRNFSVTCPSTTGEAIGLPNCTRMNVTSPPGVANPPMYPFRYNRSRHSTSSVTCPSNSSGMFAIPRFYGIPKLFARRFEVEDLARVLA